MVTIELRTFIAAPPERVFDLSRSIDLHRVSMARSREEAVAGRTSGLIGPGETVTYGQLDSQSAALGRRLIAAGVGPGSRIAILAERGPQLVRSILAVLRIGATMVPLDSE